MPAGRLLRRRIELGDCSIETDGVAHGLGSLAATLATSGPLDGAVEEM
jgi:hypothetical protein